MNHRNKTIGVKYPQKSFGDERRKNLFDEIEYKSTGLPKEVNYADIDAALLKWAEDIDIYYDKDKLPTMSVISGQRFSEYSQSWKFSDGSGGILLNFKSIGRENNPQQGTIHGDYRNIPGEQWFNLFTVPVQEENGRDCFDIYQIKQPKSVDLIYTLSIFTDKYILLNDMNAIIQDMFKATQCYVRPCGHFMPLLLDSISDESTYELNERRFYAQSFKIKCLAYILTKDDMRVQRGFNRILQVSESIGISEGTKDSEAYILEGEDTAEINFIFPSESKNSKKNKIDISVMVNNCETENVSNFTITTLDNRNEFVQSMDKFFPFSIAENEKIIIKIKRINNHEAAKIKLNCSKK